MVSWLLAGGWLPAGLWRFRSGPWRFRARLVEVSIRLVAKPNRFYNQPARNASTGGAGALIAGSVKAARVIAFEDLGTEAIRELQVTDLPLIVAIDSEGGNLYEEGPARYRR